MNTILVIWTVVAAAHSPISYKYNIYSDWRPVGTFRDPVACKTAAAELGLKSDRFRCLLSSDGKSQ